MKMYKALSIISAVMLLSHVATASDAKDIDHDGVLDELDKCLNTPQLRKANKQSRYAALFSKDELSTTPKSIPVDKQGCALDTDEDGVLDYLDYCPDNTPLEISAGVSKNGCPRQSDKDGTPDYRDKCKNTKLGQKTDRFGCPI